MKLPIGIIIIITLVTLMGCTQRQTDLRPLEANVTYCGIESPCYEGSCFKFADQKLPICWIGNPCNRCASGVCNIIKSYPMWVVCIATTSSGQAGIANPASDYCIERGWRVDIRSHAEDQTGYCVFGDGSECEEWAYFRGDCNEGSPAICKDLCGDGTCQEVVCLGNTCPCAENSNNCPIDCT